MKKFLSLLFGFSVLFLGAVSAFENVSWSATTLEAGAESMYTFEFTTTADISDPYVWIHFPVGFNTTQSFAFYGYHGPSSIDISINGGTGFYQYNGSSYWNPLRFLLGLHPNPTPDPIASGSLVQITISHILNPSSVGSYSWNNLFYYGESNNYNPQDYSVALSNVEIFAYTPFDRCDANSGSINISYQECIGLAYLYTETNGDNWYDDFNWFSNVDVTTWETNSCYYYSMINEDYYSGDFDNFCNGAPFNGSNAIVLSGGSVYGINLYDNGLQNSIQSGLAYFPDLEYLLLHSNDLTSANISQNTKLKLLRLNSNNDDNAPWVVDLSVHPLLEYVTINNLSIESIALNHQYLYYLDVDDGLLTSLDVSNLPALVYLDAEDNELMTSITGFNGKQYLRYLRFEDSAVSGSLHFADMPLLESIRADDNFLTSITLSNLPSLEYIDFKGNLLSEDGLSFAPANTGMSELDFGNNKFTVIPSSFLSLEYVDNLYMGSNCIDLDVIDPSTQTWLGSNVNSYDIDNQKYCVYVDLDGTIQGDATVERTEGSFGGSNRGAVSDIEVIRNGFLGDYLGLQGEEDQEIVYTWAVPVPVSAVHVYWQAGGNSAEPGDYFFSYRDMDTQAWITPTEWEAGSGDQDFNTSHMFTLDEAIITTGVRLFRTEECCQNGIGLSQFLVYGEVEEEEVTPPSSGGGGGGYYRTTSSSTSTLPQTIASKLLGITWSNQSVAKIQQNIATLIELNKLIQEKESVSDAMTELSIEVIRELTQRFASMKSGK